MKEWAAPDVAAAARALREIFENRELAAKKARLAREQLVERYSLANFKRDMLNLQAHSACSSTTPQEHCSCGSTKN